MIKFGTDGWRAVLGKDFTPENVARILQAFCDLYRNEGERRVYVGYDRRRASDESAKLAAKVLAANGFTALLSSRFCPTPCISWSVKTAKALAGVMITASHNPPMWNGVKFKESYGGAASPEYTGRIERRIAETVSSPPPSPPRYEDLLAKGSIRIFDPSDTYVRHLASFVDVAAVRRAGFRVAADPLYGAGAGYIREALGTDILEIHGESDPDFGGLNPEPIEKNLKEFSRFVVSSKADVGLATDGDADRIGAVDETGAYVNSHQIFALLLKHYVTRRKLSGTVVKSVSSSQWIERLCAKYRLPVVETPIGFKHISAKLLETNALMGGEESGGISLRDHVHERDGVLNGLMLLEMMAVNGKRLGGLLDDLYAEFGRFHFDRDDYHVERDRIDAIERALKESPIAKVGAFKATGMNPIDGTKTFFADDSWILLRASGTEPLLRVYAEAPTRERVRELLDYARERFKL